MERRFAVEQRREGDPREGEGVVRKAEVGEMSLGASESNAGPSQNPAEHRGGSHCGQKLRLTWMRS